MSHPQCVTSDVMPPFSWRMPGFVTVSLLVHLALIAAFLRNDDAPALLMAGAEGGVVAMTIVSVVSQRLPATSSAESGPGPVTPDNAEREMPSGVTKMPAHTQFDAVIKLAAGNEKKRETALRKVEKPHQKPVREASPVRRAERPSQNLAQAVKPVQAPEAAATNRSGEQTAQKNTAAGATSSMSSAKTGNSDSGRAQLGAGNSASQNVKALHRRVNYPQRAKAMGVEGRVRVKFTITASGTIADVRVLSETPTGMFAAAITKDMSRWRYQTGREVNDQTVTIVFKLNGQVELEN